MITRYVNTASAAGGDGTTTATSGANRAYHSTKDALAGTVVAGALPDHVQIHCVGTAADTDALDHAPMEFTTTPTNYLEIFGDNTTGKWNTSAYRIEVTNSSVVYNQYAAHVRFYNIQVMVKSTNDGGYDCFRFSTANNDISGGAPYFLFDSCIARRDPTSTITDRVDGWTNSVCGDGSSNGPLYIVNCLAIGFLGTSGTKGSCRGITDDASAWIVANQKVWNCTIVNGTYGVELTSEVKNTLSAGNTIDFVSVGSGSNYNASQDSTATGANSRVDQTFSFRDSSNGDFHLLSTDAGAKDFGVSDPGAGLYSDDIDGQTRSGSWDIGADEFIAGTAALTGTVTASITEADIV